MHMYRLSKQLMNLKTPLASLYQMDMDSTKNKSYKSIVHELISKLPVEDGKMKQLLLCTYDKYVQRLNMYGHHQNIFGYQRCTMLINHPLTDGKQMIFIRWLLSLMVATVRYHLSNYYLEDQEDMDGGVELRDVSRLTLCCL